jgi:hypothetical protein
MQLFRGVTIFDAIASRTVWALRSVGKAGEVSTELCSEQSSRPGTWHHDRVSGRLLGSRGPPGLQGRPVAQNSHDVPQPPPRTPAEVGALPMTASRTGAQRTGRLLSDRHGPAGRAPPKTSRETLGDALSGFSKRSRFAKSLRRMPQPKTALDLSSERRVDHETTVLGSSRPPSCRTLSDDRPVTATTPVPCGPPRNCRHRTAEPPRDPGQAAARRDPQRDLLTLPATDELAASSRFSSPTIIKRPTSSVMQ